jgi:MSHA pilin protein MshC
LRPASSRGNWFHHGFTMVELIVVIVLIGIIGTIAAGRFMDSTSFSSTAWTDQVRAMLRYGQKLAIAQNRPVFVLLQSDRLALCLVADAACPADQRVPAPGGANSGSNDTVARCGGNGWMCEALPAGLTMTVPSTHIAFDALGRASTPDGAAPRLSVKETGADGDPLTIAVETETGYVD